MPRKRKAFEGLPDYLWNKFLTEESINRIVIIEVIGIDNLDQEMAAELLNHAAENRFSESAYELISNTKQFTYSRELLAKVYNSCNPRTRRKLLRRDDCPLELILAEVNRYDHYRTDLVDLAASTERPEVLEALSTTRSLSLLCQVAKNKHTPWGVLKYLVLHPDEIISKFAFQNPNIPEEILRYYANCSATYTKALANPALPLDVYLRYAFSGEPYFSMLKSSEVMSRSHISELAVLAWGRCPELIERLAEIIREEPPHIQERCLNHALQILEYKSPALPTK